MAVHFEADAPVDVVTIDRPEVANAVDRPTADALVAAFRRFEADEDLAVAVLTGANNTFCAGADLKAMRAGDAERVTRVEPDGDGPVGPTRMLLAKPVIAAVEGHAVAGGLELALWCDLRVAALDLILTGRGVSGDEARAMGLANRLVEPGEACAAALALAREIASRPQAAARSDRLSAYEQWSLPLADALANEYEHGMATLRTGELFGGLESYAAGGWRDSGSE